VIIMDFQLTKDYQTFLGGHYHKYFSPGRINLIGEHIDYLGGNVFPMAISLGTYAWVSKREDHEIHMFSHNFPDQGISIVSLEDLSYKKEDGWTNFIKGMIKKYQEKGYHISHGLNILIYGTLPYSSGLSSSASIEILAGTIIKYEYNLSIKNIDMVLDAKDVENNYVGVSCGIMDQFAIGMAEKDKAIYLNTDTLEYEQIPLILNDHRLLIANTNKSRALADSKYNERVQECEQAKNQINKHHHHINEICDLKVESLDVIKGFLDPILFKRVKHALTENSRTLQAISYLEKQNYKGFGRLLYESHASLRDLYQVSCIELDTLVEAFKRHGALGARMTGAGFGGCIIALCHKDDMEKIITNVKKDYKKATGRQTDIYEVHPTGGPRRIN